MLLVQHGDLRRQRADGLILLFLRRFGGGGQLGVLFGQRIKRGFLLAFSFRALLVQRGNLRRQRAGCLILLFLCRFGSGAQFQILSRQRIDRRFLQVLT
ncbi:hypothetical protein, partial [Klebsiella michiganensis]|uniref:hypothetical protein n=1 Tax=Klebsiella michiganensis TaxID=1134687 RepID=UPI001D18D336